MTTGANLAVSGVPAPGPLAPIFYASLNGSAPAPAAQSPLAVNPVAPSAVTSALPTTSATAPTMADYVFAKAKPRKNVDPLSVQLLTQGGRQGLQFYTNKGNAAGIKTKEAVGGDANPSGFVTLDPNAQYRIINESGKNKVLYSGTGEEGLRNVYALSQELSAKMKKKANWGVEMMDPVTGTWRRVADDDPAKNIAGKIAGMALPIAAAFIPGLGVLGSIAASSLAGGVGSKLSGGKFLNGAIMGGLGAAGGSLLGPAISGGLGVTSNVGRAIGTGVGNFGGGIATGQSLKNSLIGGVTAGGLSYLGGELLGPRGGNNGPTRGEQFIDSLGGNQSLVPQMSPGQLTAAVSQGLGPAYGNYTGGDLAVSGAGGAAPTLTPSPNTGGASPGATGNEIVVTGSRFNPGDFDPGVLAAVGLGGLTAAQLASLQSSLPNGGSGMKLSDIANYARVAALGVGLVGSLFEGGSGGPGSATMPPNPGGSPWAAQLPAPTTQPRVARVMPPQDWTRYGTRPEQSFFTNVPQGYMPPGPGINDDAWDHFAEGGLAVRGVGDGREDAIPAMLSDGEYVVDAETVALLGNGSNKAGAKALDELRVRVRQHKGGDLAVGKFTRPAKRPEQYLKGRKHA